MGNNSCAVSKQVSGLDQPGEFTSRNESDISRPSASKDDSLLLVHNLIQNAGQVLTPEEPVTREPEAPAFRRFSLRPWRAWREMFFPHVHQRRPTGNRAGILDCLWGKPGARAVPLCPAGAPHRLRPSPHSPSPSATIAS